MLNRKTSLAPTIGMNALEKGVKIMYLTLDDLLLESKLKKKCWNNVLNADLIIVDDVFYLTPTEDELEYNGISNILIKIENDEVIID